MQLPIRLGCAVSLVRIALHPLLLCTSLALRSFVGKKWGLSETGVFGISEFIWTGNALRLLRAAGNHHSSIRESATNRQHGFVNATALPQSVIKSGIDERCMLLNLA